MKVLYILSGPSGSGKSTFARKLSDEFGVKDDSIICCADDYHMVRGEYMFDASKLPYAHGSCRNKCYKLMDKGVANIIIANTNTTWKEIKIYVDMAKECGYNVVFGRPLFNLTVNELSSRNVHNVPEASLQAMKNRMISQDELKTKMVAEFPSVPFIINQFENK